MASASDLKAPRDREINTWLENLYRSGSYSDLKIVSSDGKEYKVHKNVVCPRSKFFEGACKQGLKEAETGVVNLPDDDPQAVQLMIHYLYILDYPFLLAPDYETAVESKKSDNYHVPSECSKLLTHATVYALAKKYAIDGLKTLAKHKFDTELQRVPRPSAAGSERAIQASRAASPRSPAPRCGNTHLKAKLLQDKDEINRSHSTSMSPVMQEFMTVAEYVYTSAVDEDPGLRDIVAKWLAENQANLLNKPDYKEAVKNVEGLAFDLLECTAQLHEQEKKESNKRKREIDEKVAKKMNSPSARKQIIQRILNHPGISSPLPANALLEPATTTLPKHRNPFAQTSKQDLRSKSSNSVVTLHTFPGLHALLDLAEVEDDIFYITGAASISASNPFKEIWRIDVRGLRASSIGTLLEPPTLSLVANDTSGGLYKGMTRFSSNDTTNILVVDSVLGTVTRLNTATGDLKVVVNDPLLHNTNSSNLAVAVNGIHTFDSSFYFTNLNHGIFGRMPISLATGEQTGPAEVIATGLWVADDFALSRDGKTAWVAMNGPGTLIEVDIERKIQRVLADSMLLGGESSVAVGRGADEGSLYITTNQPAGNTTVGGIVKVEVA